MLWICGYSARPRVDSHHVIWILTTANGLVSRSNGSGGAGRASMVRPNKTTPQKKKKKSVVAAGAHAHGCHTR
jgi:hypothetical protein